MEPIYKSIRKRAREIASRNPLPKFYQDYSTATQLSRNIFRSEPLIREIRNQITRQLENDFGHGLKHAVKVAFDIGILMIVEANRSGYSDAYTQRRVVLAQCAALLHDIERKQDEHARVGSDTANQILHDYPFAPDEIEDISLAIRNHEAFKSTAPLKTDEGTLLSDCLYDADKFRWGPDNFTDTVWRMVSFSKTPFDKFVRYYPKGMKSLGKIKTTFRTDTGKQYGPQFIDLGIAIGEALYRVILDEYSDLNTEI
ncbi:MAG TPA: HD domain-containing protein [Deltaproteobacteria bacterium]|nr:HD domain-containing protein [Deltaproteobacteria bacterium]